jgi:integrase
MAGRRGNNEGTIKKRSDGRWEGRVSFENGTRKSVYGKTRAEAAKRLTELMRDKDRGLPSVAETVTVGRYLQDWLDGCKPPALEYSTWNGYEQYVRLHLTPSFGGTKLVKLSPQQVQALYAEKLAAGLSSTTVRHIHACLHRALDQALRFGLVQRNVASLVKAPPMRKSAMRVYTPEQAKLLLAAARGERLEALYVLALSTGMREGELLGLTWRDVNLETGTVHVQASMKHVGGGKRLIGKPKTSGSRRKLTLTPRALDALTAHRARQLTERTRLGPAWQEHDLVFCNTVGNALDPTNFYRYEYKPLLKRAGLPPIRFHDLRHTAATLLLLSGIHPKVVSEMLGHSTVTITLNLYSHVLPDMQQAATDAMERLLGN